ncbi:hypothetical protein E2C01_023337 [Portunus trituberculatus]|uniref:Uncharacterized protein n=1 Tax=Portunus trituberculatus TaxID=210409 RepID=A0A5B7E7R0_PORTR|nr:hypothetical protein [Portunus trituberculatus]
MRTTIFFCIVCSISFRNLHWHQRSFLVIKIRNLVRVLVLVSHSSPVVGLQESHQEMSYQTSSWMVTHPLKNNFPPSPHPSLSSSSTLLITSLHLQ